MNRRNLNQRLLGLAVAATVPAALAACASTAARSARKRGPVDTHAHVFHRGLPFVPNRRYTPGYDATAKEYLATLDANQMAYGVIIPISILGTNNDYTVRSIAESAGRLKGLAVVDPGIEFDKLEALDRAGLVGIRLNLIGKPVPDVTQGPWRELIAKCRRLNWQVEVYDDAKRLPTIIKPLIDSGVNVVVDHFGKPDVALGIADPGFKYLLGVGGTRQVWVKLSAPYRSSDAIASAAAPHLLNAFGPGRLMWGSDWPHTGFEGKVEYAALKSQLSNWVPDPAQRRIVLEDTPLKLFRF
ncbi:MAG: amidohydrolase family protein [Burkholderiales bacterium]